ncbi:MAG: PEP/pyruvate-binding domain-containing protein [Thermoleophilia bacterium]
MTTLWQKIGSMVGRYSGRREVAFVDVRQAFTFYKKIMDDNGRALEIITDMGEKMSGGYLFDIVYIRKAYAELAASMRFSLMDFNKMTTGRYPELENVLNEINSRIEALISGTNKPLERLVVRFEDITSAMAREVGGKNFHLAELRNKLKLDAPEGFALTVFAYEEFIRNSGLGDLITELENDGNEPERRRLLREQILKGDFPHSMEKELADALAWLRGHCGNDCRLAVRSSAEEEDDVFSFAGQFETVLNVPSEPEAVRDAYRQVVASLFSDEAMTYQRRFGFRPGSLRMAVGVVTMVDAAASGVIYTADPLGKKPDVMVINSAWGLGKSVVEGSTDADKFTVSKTPPFALVASEHGKKETMTALAEGGTRETETPGNRQQIFSLTPAEIEEIARQALAIENYYHQPQDIEWAFDENGQVYFLQSRPLRLIETADEKTNLAEDDRDRKINAPRVAEHPVLISNRGTVVQPGAVGGRVFLVNSPEILEEFPRDAILVARSDSPQFVRAMPYASAIITDSGNTASHMASISREFRVPTVVGAGNATQLLKPGAEITLKADEDGSITVYEGIVREIIDKQHDSFLKLEELYEFRRRKYVMRYITPLNLVNPFTDDFTPEKCQTVHDVLRFIHEKSMRELIESSRRVEIGPSLKRLDIPLMDDIHVIDIGAGLAGGTDDSITPEQLTSVPLKAILEGMSYPGIWRKGGVPISLSDFFTASMRAGPVLEDIDINLAVISHYYMNLAVRFGYHYNIVDCYCSERAASNHIYFRFMGGAADISKRMRRIELLEIILKHLGFISRAKGDMITATMTNISQEEAVRILDQAGRLMAFTRQLDAMLNSDNLVKHYAQRFIEGDYNLFEENA